MKRIYGTARALALATCVASAQDAMTMKQMAEEAAVKAQLSASFAKMQIIGMEGGVMSNIKGAPYSAEQITETTQTLGDGTRIHNENSVKLYRDSEGRVRRETPEMISIFDPVSGTGYTLDPKTMTAGKMQVAVSVNRGSGTFSYSGTAPGGDDKAFHVFSGNAVSTTTAVGHGVGAGAGAGVGTATGGVWSYTTSVDGSNMAFRQYKSAANAKVEALPAQMMEGVNVQGQRRTQTIEAGEIGNDRPIQIVDERWTSPDLQLDVMTRHSDPRTGEQTMHLVNVSRGDPNATLFQVPAGYQINEGKSFPAMKMTPMFVKDKEQ